jgi:DNA-binding NarL/FixJ family response regulator
MLRGLTDFLKSKGFNIAGSASDGNSAYNLIVKLKPEIAILDIRMPHKTGLEIAEACKNNGLITKVILITFDKEEELYNKAKSFNVYGYILKEFAIEEIEICIGHVIKNEKYFSEEIASYLNSKIKYSNAHIKDLLTKTELKIVKLLSKNKSNQEISDTLQSSIRTIEKHRSNIVKKLKLQKSHNALMLWANLNKDLF